MVTGAPAPGGRRAPAPGGVHSPVPGGIDLDSKQIEYLLEGRPDTYFSGKAGMSVPLSVAIQRTVKARMGVASAITTYLWTLPTKPGGSGATVTGGSTATASFTPDLAGEYIFRCAVTFTVRGAAFTVTKDLKFIGTA